MNSPMIATGNPPVVPSENLQEFLLCQLCCTFSENIPEISSENPPGVVYGNFPEVISRNPPEFFLKILLEFCVEILQ